MKRSDLAVGALAVVAYILTVVGLFSSFEASVIVIPMICLAAIPVSLCVKVMFEGDSSASRIPVAIVCVLIIALYLVSLFIGQGQMYSVVIQMIAWAFVGFLVMSRDSGRAEAA